MKSKIFNLDDPVGTITEDLIRRIRQHQWHHQGTGTAYKPRISEAFGADERLQRVGVIKLTDWSEAVTTFTITVESRHGHVPDQRSHMWNRGPHRHHTRDCISIRVSSDRECAKGYAVQVYADGDSAYRKMGRILSWCERVFARRDLETATRVNGIKARFDALLDKEQAALQEIIDGTPAEVTPRMVLKRYPRGTFVEMDRQDFNEYLKSNGVEITERRGPFGRIPAIRGTWPEHLSWIIE